MSSLPTFTSSFDPFGPSTQTPPPTKPVFLPPVRERSTPETALNLSIPGTPLPGLYSHHQQKSVNAFTYPHRPSSWTYNPNLGIIHDGACTTCTEYVKHVWEAMEKNDSSIAQAMRSRTNSLDAYFMDGFGMGVRQFSGKIHAADNSVTVIDRYNTAMRTLELCAAENASLRMDLQYAKSQLANSQDVLQRLKVSLAGQTSPTSTTSHLSPSDNGSMGSSASSSTRPFQEKHAQMGVLQSDFASMLSLPSKTEPYEVCSRVANTLDTRYSVPTQNSPPCPVLTYASVASSDVPQAITSNRSSILTAKSANHSPRFNHEKFSDDSLNKPRPRQPRTIAELKDLMELAGDATPEGAKALAIVKRVCFSAHSTPRELKNGLQKFALTNWRNPFTASPAQSSTVVAKPNPRLGDPVEVWYDYLCTHPHSWPKGVCKDADGKPVMSQLIASRAIAQMRPTESAISRNEFNNQVVDMFSVPGMYKHLVEQNGFAIAPHITFQPFTGPVTADSVAQHFSRCGFGPEDATENFEPWAKHWKEL